MSYLLLKPNIYIIELMIFSLQRPKDAAKMLWVWNSKQNWNIFLHIHTSPTFFAAQHLMATENCVLSYPPIKWQNFFPFYRKSCKKVDRDEQFSFMKLLNEKAYSTTINSASSRTIKSLKDLQCIYLETTLFEYVYLIHLNVNSVWKPSHQKTKSTKFFSPFQNWKLENSLNYALRAGQVGWMGIERWCKYPPNNPPCFLRPKEGLNFPTTVFTLFSVLNSYLNDYKIKAA